MRITLEWLNEWFTAPLDAAAVGEGLTWAGFELESVDWVRPGLETVVTGRLLTADPHPNADRLRVCQTAIGQAEPLQIVTAATNVQMGDIVPVALVGSKLPTGKEIGPAKMRGEDSFGMFCSDEELGLAAAAEGVRVLPADTAIGQPIAAVLKLGDPVLDIAVSANRGDALSVRGLARELAAAGVGVLAARDFLDPGTVPASPRGISTSAFPPGGISGLVSSHGSSDLSPPEGSVKITLNAPDLCPRYSGLIVRGIKVGPSPDWLAKRLELAGIRPISNAVDVMNYVMLEFGQPMHAFDLAKIDAGTLSARRARLGEHIVTLDETDRLLDPDMLVIADAQVAHAIAGVMGGQASAVSASTSDVLLEAAYFLPSTVRSTSKRLGLKSESSYRFERGVDPEFTALALQRAAALLAEVAGGKIEATYADARHEGFPQPIAVTLRPARTGKILGLEVPTDEQVRILEGLGFELHGGLSASSAESSLVAREVGGEAGTGSAGAWPSGIGPTGAGTSGAVTSGAATSGAGNPGNLLTFRVPGWRRHDVLREIDLIEEIARMVGLDKIPETLPKMADPPEPHRPRLRELRSLLRGAGFHEITTSSLTSRKLQQQVLGAIEGVVELANPLGEMQVLRLSLLPSLLEVAKVNFNSGADRLMIFEAGQTYAQPARERRAVCALAVADLAVGLWKEAPEALQADFWWAKGIARTALQALGLTELEALPHRNETALHPGRAARFEAGGHAVAVFGELHPSLAEAFDLPGQSRAAVIMLDVDAIQAVLEAQGPKALTAIPRFPVSIRDLAVLVDDTLPAGRIEILALQAGKPLVEDVAIFDRYQGPQVPAGKVSLALRLAYRAVDRTLTDAAVDAAHQQIVKALAEQCGATLRA